jgi:hypothetical protein
LLQGVEGVGIFGAQVDVALGRAHRQAGDGHAFDQAEGVALHQHAVGEGARIAFVGVAHHVLFGAGSVQHGVPLDAGGEGRAAAAAQAGVGDFLDDGGAIQGDRLLQPSKPPWAW